MKNAKFLFWIHKSQINKSGKAPIRMRITLSKTDKVEISTGLMVEPDKWDVDNKKLKGKTSEADQLNRKLRKIESDLINIEEDYQRANKAYTAESIRNTFLGKDQINKSLLTAIKEHNEYFSVRIGQKGYNKKTYSKYTGFKDKTEQYIKSINRTDILLAELKPGFIEDFETWLLLFGKKTKEGNAPLNRDSASNHLKKLKKITAIACRKDDLAKDPFKDFKIEIAGSSRQYLSQEELMSIQMHDFIPRLSLVRDRFIIQCWTGLSQSDLDSLTTDDIVVGIDGVKYISRGRIKTGEECLIPIFPVTQALFDKYKDSSDRSSEKHLVPDFSNQNMNGYLKEIAVICSISKKLTTNVGRHTFATMMLNNGMTLEDVANMLGHSSTRITKHYARLHASSILSRASVAYQNIIGKAEHKQAINE